MSKIIEFEPKEIQDKKRVGSFIEMTINDVQKNNIDNLIILYKDKKNGDIYIGVCNQQIGEIQELCSHLQVHIIEKIIEKNLFGEDE